MQRDNDCVRVRRVFKKIKAGKVALKAICLVVCYGILARTAGMYGDAMCTVQASPARVHSGGRIRYEYAVIDADDLWEIDAHISARKSAAAEALLRLGTRFRQQSGEYAYDRNPDIGPEDIDVSGLGWEMITRAAKESQSVPEGLAVLHPEAALGIEGVEERTDCYAAAVEDNLSVGKAAWVDGRLLLGNGADNDRAYRQGQKDGSEGRIPEQLRPIYGVCESGIEIRHTHVGSAEEREGISGCYHNYSQTSEEVISCDRMLQFTQAVWSPDENEPGGGTWHGGFYTCTAHGGSYDAPGRCPYEKVILRIGWFHDTVCGLDNMLYARLTIKEADKNAGEINQQPEETEQQPEETDQQPEGTEQNPEETMWGQICLEAVLEEGEGFGKLAWLEGDRLVWTDSYGNTLGTGPKLTVFEPGVYRCSVHAGNTDINCRTAEAVVRVSGLMAPGN